MAPTVRRPLLLLILIILVPTSQVVAAPDEAFFHIGDNVFVGGFDLHGEELAWARANTAGIHILVTNLTSGDERLATAVAARATVRDLAFDGRWIVWSDDRFGQFDVFALDTSTSQLRRLTNTANLDESSVDAAQGRAVWSDGSQAHVMDLQDMRSFPIPRAEAAKDQEPAIWGDLVVTAHVEGGERVLQAYRISDGSTWVAARFRGGSVYRPALEGDVAVWETLMLLDPDRPGRGVAGSIVHVGNMTSGDIHNLTAPVAEPRPSLGGHRVAWSTSDGTALRVDVLHLGAGDVQSIPGSAAQMSDDYIVVATPSAAGLQLHARLWQVDAGREAPTVAWPAAAAVLALAASARRRGATP